MATDRWSIVRKAIEAAVDGADGSAIESVCGAAVALLSLKGAGVCLMVDGELRGSVGGPDRGIALLNELQLTLGEGPSLDAWRLGGAVLEPDLAAPALARWPVFSVAGVRSGVRAVFALPLHLGAIAIGVLVLYRERPGALSADELAYGLVLAEVAAQLILALQAVAEPDTLHALLSEQPAHWAEIHQATGIVSLQLTVALDEAFVRLRAHAFASGRPLREIARDVVDRRLHLDG
ncbi:MAG TPA: GAF and ANTAR domain-containing protein [Solirubrobacteraceae bacterium]|nr:GAF and ANTAR domain-containing protein [Solirubrobacteraceae bacterium]